MDLSLTKDYQTYRTDVRDFLKRHANKAPRGALRARPDDALRRWQKTLIEHGYAARTIPKQYGGAGREPDVLKSRIIAEEFAASGMPRGIANQGVSMLVPTLLELGSEAQREQYIRPTLYGEMVWCQGYSEPGAGSDLASLATAATEDGEDFVINGQKIWTSTAREADMMFCLVRTEPNAPKHKGISYILLRMDSPGIEVRPLKTMTGHAEFNEVFFTNVRVPKANLVAGRGEGWLVANATLTHERGMLGDPNEAGTRLAAIIALMQDERRGNEPLMKNPVLRDRLGQLQARVLAMHYHGLRLLTMARRKESKGMAGLIVKLMGCELNHELAGFAIDCLGELGILYGSGRHLRARGQWQHKYMFDLGMIIGGGTAQIQKNIISERGLGMPREPKPQSQSQSQSQSKPIPA